MNKNFIDRTGERRQNTEGYWMEIIECFGARNNTVKFDDYDKLIEGVRWDRFNEGKVKRPWVYTDSLYYRFPIVAKSIAIPENNLTLEDTKLMSCGLDDMFYTKCFDCNKVSSKKKRLGTLTRQGVPCEYCSDNISIPNKMLRQISERLNLNWKFEYSPEWLKIGNSQYSFDAYDDNLKIAIEADAHHKINNNHKGNRKEIDNLKDKLAREHGINVIRIDLMNTKEYDNNKFEYIKQQYYMALNDNYNLDKLDWNKAFINSQKSLMIEACRLWQEDKIYSAKEISEILKLGNSTVRRYLKRGNKLGLCDYTPEKANKESAKKRNSIYHYKSDLYWVIKSNGEKYSDRPLCGIEVYNHHSIGLLNISFRAFDKYVKPYNNIDISRIQGNYKGTIQTKEKLTPFDGWQFIPLSKEEKQQYLESIK